MAVASSIPAPSSTAGLARPIIVTCLMAGTLMQTLDATIANVALPYMQGGLSASQDQITWVLTSYVIASAVMTAPVGWLAGRFGRKNFYIVSLMGFTVASILCGAAQSLEEIVLYRLLQGAFGAALSPLSQSMMLDLYPAEKRGEAMALFGTGIMLGPVLGPTVGGYLTEYISWRWVFYVNVPFGVAAVMGLLLFPSKGQRDTTTRFDWTGFGFLSLGLGAMQLMLDRGTGQGWFSSSEIVLEGSVAILGLYLFSIHMLTTDTPFIPRGLFRDTNFVASFFAMFLLAQLLFASMAALPPYLQHLGGYTVLDVGLMMSPRGIGTMIGLQLSGRLANRVDARIMLIGGVVLSCATMWMMGHWTPAVGLWEVVGVGVVQGFSMSLFFAPINYVAFATLPAELRTSASAFINLARNLGGAIGISLSTALIAASIQTAHAELAAHVTPFNRALHMNAPGLFWNTTLPNGAASLNQVIEGQAQAIAYSDNFIFLGYLALMTLLSLFLMRKPPPVSEFSGPSGLD